jgi:hypothetical protein
MVEINTIKNKLKREELYQKQKNAKAKAKRDRRTTLQKEESSNPEKKEVTTRKTCFDVEPSIEIGQSTPRKNVD